MNDWQLIALVLGSVTLGALVYAAAQLAGAIATLSREASSASREIREVALLLKPVARRLDRLSTLAIQSEPDLQELQRSMRQIATGSRELSENFARVSGWVGIAAPIVTAAVEGWAGYRAADHGSHPAPATEQPTPAPDADPGGEVSANHRPPTDAHGAAA